MLLHRLLEDVDSPRTSSSSACLPSRAAGCSGNLSGNPAVEPTPAVAGHRSDRAPVLQHRYVAEESDAEHDAGRSLAQRDRDGRGRRATGAARLVRRSMPGTARYTPSTRRTPSPPISRAPRSRRLPIRQIGRPTNDAFARTDAALTDVVTGSRPRSAANTRPIRTRGGCVWDERHRAVLRRGFRTRHFSARGRCRGLPEAPAPSWSRVAAPTASIGTARRSPIERARRLRWQPDEPRIRGAQDEEPRERQHQNRQADILALGSWPNASTSSIALACWHH